MFYLQKKFTLFKLYICTETHIQIDKKKLFFV